MECIKSVEELEVSPQPRRASGFDHDLSVRLQLFATRMTELSVRARSVWLLRVASRVLAFDGCVEVEAIALLSLLRNSAARLGLAGDRFLRETSKDTVETGPQSKPPRPW
jgi:hypothetical protein